MPTSQGTRTQEDVWHSVVTCLLSNALESKVCTYGTSILLLPSTVTLLWNPVYYIIHVVVLLWRFEYREVAIYTTVEPQKYDQPRDSTQVVLILRWSCLWVSGNSTLFWSTWYQRKINLLIQHIHMCMYVVFSNQTTVISNLLIITRHVPWLLAHWN